jgi:hypothetical protein
MLTVKIATKKRRIYIVRGLRHVELVETSPTYRAINLRIISLWSMLSCFVGRGCLRSVITPLNDGVLVRTL